MQIQGHSLNISAPWLSGAKNDLALFFAPGLVAVCLTGLFKQDALVNSPYLLFLILQGFGLGPFHQGLTWFQFLDKENLAEYGSQKNFVWAFAVPALLILISAVAYWFWPTAIFCVYALWTIQHIAKQNTGILLLYHNHNRNEVIVERGIELGIIESSAALFAFVFLNNFIAQTGWVPILVHLTIAVIAIELVWLVVRFLTNFAQQVSEGKCINGPATAFWLISCLAFVPFALTKNYNQGLFVALVMHWFQYVGLNGILLNRKYLQEGSFGKHQVLGKQPVLMFLATGILFALLALPVDAATIDSAFKNVWQVRILVGIIYGLTLSHYFLDAFIWRFREAFNRQSILVYLKPSPTMKPVDMPVLASLTPDAERQTLSV